MTKRGFLAAFILICVGVMLFLYLHPVGIRIGYIMSGGVQQADETANPESILRQYEEQVAAYQLYKDSENQTVRKWSDTARERANDLARQYNEIFGEYILEEIRS